MIYDVLIVGAGISGLSAATALQERGASVLVLEKSRGLGGRAATRRWDNLPVDHGAQFFTVRTPEFGEQVRSWLAEGVCHEWTRGFHRYDGHQIHGPAGDHHPRYVCRAGMSSLGKSLVSRHGLRVETQAKIESIEVAAGVWALASDDGRAWKSRGLIMTAPPAQAAVLLEASSPATAALARSQPFLPCLAVAVRLPKIDLPWRGVQCDDTTISWVSNDTSKRPDMHGGYTVVVIHAHPDFSARHYDQSPNDVVPKIIRHASAITGIEFFGADFFFHRWRYALPLNEGLSSGVFSTKDSAPLVLAGDTWVGGKIEGAWCSGIAAANSCATML
jgi:predicted NAD/FAD-dependent oxidoreductase